MTGTETQIAWAEEILYGARAQLDSCEASIARQEAKFPGEGEDLAQVRMEHIAKLRADLEKLAAAQSNASWWITNRSRFAADAILRALHGMYAQSRKA